MTLNDVWIDNFESWEEIWEILRDDWSRIDDQEAMLRLERDVDDLLVVELDRHLRARQRRGLHRMGFRPTAGVRVTVWHWDAEAALRHVDLRDFSTSFERVFDAWDPAVRPVKIQRHRSRLARDHLMTEQTQRVLQEVFRCRPQDLAIALYRDPAEWDEDDDWQLPTG